MVCVWNIVCKPETFMRWFDKWIERERKIKDFFLLKWVYMPGKQINWKNMHCTFERMKITFSIQQVIANFSKMHVLGVFQNIYMCKLYFWDYKATKRKKNAQNNRHESVFISLYAHSFLEILTLISVSKWFLKYLGSD